MLFHHNIGRNYSLKIQRIQTNSKFARVKIKGHAPNSCLPSPTKASTRTYTGRHQKNKVVCVVKRKCVEVSTIKQ